MPSTLLWFRRDLRLTDLPPLLDAAADGSEVLACFVLDPRLEARAGARRLQFLGDCLRGLNDDLDGRLLITRGRPEEKIPQIAAAIGAKSVHISADFSPFGMRRDDAVAAYGHRLRDREASVDGHDLGTADPIDSSGYGS